LATGKKKRLSETLQVKQGTIHNSRSVPNEHIPKKACNFEEPIIHDKKFDNTTDRIHGVRVEEKL
jgi:hypothetical protein